MATTTPVYLLFLGAATFLYLLRALLSAMFSPLRHIPGPFLAHFTDFWYFQAVRKGQFEKVNLALHRQYGPVVRYGPNRYSISDPSASKIIYRLGPDQFPKSSWYDAMGNPGRAVNLFTERNVERHAQDRRLYQAMYAMTSLISYEPYVDHCADLFCQRLDELAAAGAPADLGRWLQCYAFDVIGMITYSKRLGFLDAGEDVGGPIAALEDFLRNGVLLGPFPLLFRWQCRWQRTAFADRRGRGGGLWKVIEFTMARMAEHQKSRPKAVALDGAGAEVGVDTTAAEDFLTKFYARHRQAPHEFTAQHVQSGCLSNMGAGSDTTAISLSAVVYHLMRNRACLERLRAEVDGLASRSHVAEAAAGARSGSHVSFRDSQQMPYLQAVIKEALRVHPATGLPLERVAPAGGATIAGQFFPGGTIVGVNTWVEHYNPQIFGPDPAQFRPERWLIDDAEKLAEMNRHWIPFGLGARTCLGRHISMLEMSKLIPRLVREFDFEFVGDGEKDWTTVNTWFVKPKNFVVRIRRRI